MKIKAGIIGATGYAGAELVRLLTTHPNVEISAISSVSFEGKKLSEVYPSYRCLCDMECKNADEVVEKSDVIFAALPHGLSQELAATCDKAGKAFIDLGADFRLESEEEYKAKLSAREVNFWFDGKPAEFIAALSNNQSLSKEDIKQIRGLLDEMDQ